VKAPVIGIVGGAFQAAANFSARLRLCSVAEAILEVMLDHGGTPVILPDRVPPGQADRLTGLCDGLLLPPGRDLDPASYGAASEVRYDAADGIGEPGRRPHPMMPDPVRDRLEIALFDAMARAGRPVLGLCRGMQLINVARGGTLHQELLTGQPHFLEPDGWIPYHPIRLVPGVALSRILGQDDLTVSSVHHQGIDLLGKGLRVSATSPDGVIEAIEDDSGAFVFGLQSHPEKTRAAFPRTERLFAAFIAASRETRRDS
jgi:putative glutamine amidotransferase